MEQNTFIRVTCTIEDENGVLAHEVSTRSNILDSHYESAVAGAATAVTRALQEAIDTGCWSAARRVLLRLLWEEQGDYANELDECDAPYFYASEARLFWASWCCGDFPDMATVNILVDLKNYAELHIASIDRLIAAKSGEGEAQDANV